jgi:hypothetical protein
MSRQLREHIRTQLKTILESKYGYYKDKDGRIKQGDLATAWKERIKSAVEDEEDRKDLSLKNVMKGIKDEEDIKEVTDDEVKNAKEILDLEKKTTQEKKKQSDLDNMEEAELSPKQKKADFAALKSKKKLKEYINEMIPSLLEVDEEEELEGEFPEEESQEDDAFVPNHYKPEFIPREAEQALEKLGLTPIDRYVDFVNFMNSVPKSLKVVLTNGNSFLMYFDEDGLRLQIGANEIDISDDRTLPEAQDMINDLLMGPVDVPEEEEEAAEEVPEEEPAAEEEPTEEEPAEEEPEA